MSETVKPPLDTNTPSKDTPIHALPAGQVKKEKAGLKAPLKKPQPKPVIESGGPKGLEPTRYGDWEKGGRCSDF